MNTNLIIAIITLIFGIILSGIGYLSFTQTRTMNSIFLIFVGLCLLSFSIYKFIKYKQ